MAWIRTCLSLISFGFGLDRIVEAIRNDSASASGSLGVRMISLAFVLTGVVAMVAATSQHRLVLRRLMHDDFTYREQTSIAGATAWMLSLIGLLAMALLLLGGLHR